MLCSSRVVCSSRDHIMQADVAIRSADFISLMI